MTRVVDEAGLADWHGVWAATTSYDYVGLPADPIADLRSSLAGPSGGQLREFWTAYDEGAAVSAVELRVPIHDNLDLVNVEVHVLPEVRRRGHGRRALLSGLDRGRELSRTRALVEVPTKTRHLDPSPGEALARSIGAQPLHAETRRLLELSAVTEADLDRLQGLVASDADGYSSVAWRNHTPTEYVEDMAALTALMSTDPPQGELNMEPEVWDAARYLEHEASIIRRGGEHLTVAARDDSTGRLVGFTALGVPSGGATVGYQWETIVSGEHRGHRLGLLLKVANLRQLRATLPEVQFLNTWNADENTHMVAVNEKIGFRPMETWTEWGIDLLR